LDTVAQAYARRAGISLGGGGGGAAVGGVVGGAVMNSEEFNQFQAKQNALMYQHLEIYARYLEKDLRAGDKLFEEEKLATLRLQSDIDQWMAEHGDYYAEGIKPVFSTMKARVYDSHWNWVRQDALALLYDMIFGRLTVVDREVMAQCIHVMNRANPQLLEFMVYHIDNTASDRGKTYALAKEFGTLLIQNCREVLEAAPVYKDGKYSRTLLFSTISCMSFIDSNLVLLSCYSWCSHWSFNFDRQQGQHLVRGSPTRRSSQVGTLREGHVRWWQDVRVQQPPEGPEELGTDLQDYQVSEHHEVLVQVGHQVPLR
jgi:3-oxoacyl-ACP reductase-like protein